MLFVHLQLARDSLLIELCCFGYVTTFVCVSASSFVFLFLYFVILFFCYRSRLRLCSFVIWFYVLCQCFVLCVSVLRFVFVF